jgi:anti-sigma regulatory factor (Ser/Thr protein kinase)
MALDRAFDAETLPDLRKAVLAQAAAAGMLADRATDVMLAVHELAANAVRHGAGTGRLAMRVRGGQLLCEVSDVGPPRDDGHGPRTAIAAMRPWPVQRGHGLWLVRAAADQVSVALGSAGSRVTAVFNLPGPFGESGGQSEPDQAATQAHACRPAAGPAVH